MAVESSGGPLLQQLVRFGALQPDGSQLASVQALHLLQGLLSAQAAREAAAAQASSADDPAAAPAALPAHPPSAVQGAYMWGPRGRGKKMIMELFSRTLPPHVRVRHHSLPWLLQHVEEQCRELEQVLPPRRHADRGKERQPSRGALQRKRRAVGAPAPPAAAGAAGTAEGAAAAASDEDEEDAFEAVAGGLAASCHLLCIDKVQLDNRRDAAAFSRLLEELLWRGCWVAFMSNRPLDELLRGADLEMEREGPFLELCNTHLLQLNVSGGPSYHAAGAAEGEPAGEPAGGGARCYVGPAAAEELRAAWSALAASSGGVERGAAVAFKFFGRDKLWVPKALVGGAAPGHQCVAQQQQQRQPPQRQQARQPGGCGGQPGAPPCGAQPAAPRPAAAGAPPLPPPPQPQPQPQQAQNDPPLVAAYFEFEQLFGPRGLRPAGAPGPAAPPAPLTPMDCLALAESGAGAVFIEGVPRLGPERRGEAMRFVTLVDVLYDHGTQLHISAEAGPDEIFAPLLDEALAHTARPGFWEAAAAPPQQRPRGGAGHEEQALLAEEVLMLKRAASRLAQMTRR